MRLAWGLGLMALAVILAGVGAILCLWALYQYLVAALDAPTAALVAGVAALATAGVVAWLVRRLTR